MIRAVTKWCGDMRLWVPPLGQRARFCSVATKGPSARARRLPWTAPAGACTAATIAVLAQQITSKCEAESSARAYTHDEITKLVDSGRIIVAYECGVYDVTDFTGHPGGIGRLQMAAGGDLGVFWKTYTQHNRGHVVDYVMKPYKIGECSADTMADITAGTSYDVDSVYGDNPEPYPDLLLNTRYPHNAEGRLADRTDSFITPIGKHFVRNHNAVPNIDPDEYTLTINGEGVTETVFTLQDLKTKFQKVDVTTVIQCNGNRR